MVLPYYKSLDSYMAHLIFIFSTTTTQQGGCYKSAQMALSTGMHIHRQCGGTVFSHDLFFLANGKEKCASVINGHDYLLRKCGFLAQQLHFYDLNPGQDASSWERSCGQTAHTAFGDGQTYH